MFSTTSTPTPAIKPNRNNANTRKAEETMRNVEQFAARAGVDLRPYQLAVVKNLMWSIVNHKGLSFVIIFPRQSGKDEFLVWLKTYLLRLFAHVPASMVEINPTYKPQTINALERFEQALALHQLTRNKWRKRGDFMRLVGLARVSFLSGDAGANVVGATASLLLIVNEAQDIRPADFDKKHNPMTASTNATKLFAGTVWTSNTLLHREMTAAKEQEKQDGIQRVFMFDANDVRQIVAWYGQHVDEVVRKQGRNHPMIKTQYFNETIDAQAGMFNEARRALMKGDQPAHAEPQAGTAYIFCIDVAGVDEAANKDPEAQFMANPGRDSTTLTIYAVDLSEYEIRQAPVFRIIHRAEWQGQNHVVMWGKLKAYNDIWRPQTIIMDATGVGEGLYSMFSRCCGHKIIPVKFSAQKKSEIGYRYIGMIETGRIRDCAPSARADEQYAKCQSEVLPGPQKTLRWGVPEGTRNAEGELIHDDILLADALIAEADALDWSIASETIIVPARDVLQDMEGNY